jgi:hypothetical protein
MHDPIHAKYKCGLELAYLVANYIVMLTTIVGPQIVEKGRRVSMVKVKGTASGGRRIMQSSGVWVAIPSFFEAHSY